MKNKEPKGRKVSAPKKAKTAQELLVIEIDRALTLMVATCESSALQFNTQHIPVAMVKTFKDIIIKNYKEGLKTNPNFKS